MVMRSQPVKEDLNMGKGIWGEKRGNARRQVSESDS
jgi:hypothetical protein